MSQILILEEVTQQGTRELGRLQGGEVLIGREPDAGGIAVSSKAVSRNHAVFTRVRSHWIFKDLGSTNGSWLNGVQIKEGEWKVIRPGAMLQLADAVLRIAAGPENFNSGQAVSSGAAIGGRSLLVFSASEFVDEFPIPEYGKALVVGGSQADLAIEGDIFEQPSLVIERRADSIVAFRPVRDLEVRYNGQPATDTVNLSDGDLLAIGVHTILLNDPTRSSLNMGTQARSAIREWGNDSRSSSVEGQDYSPRPRTNKSFSTFGHSVSDDASAPLDETVALNADEIESRLQGADMHPSMRYNMRSPGIPSLNTTEDKIILGVGIILSLILMTLVVWWVFF